MIARIVVVSIALSLSMGCQSSVGQVLRQQRYSEIRPPSKLPQPGLVVEVKNSKPMELGIICDPRHYGEDLAKYALPSPSASQTIKRKLERRFKLSGSYLQEAEGRVDYAAVKSISLTFENVVVTDIAKGSLYKLRESQDPDCTKAISDGIREKDRLTAIVSVVQADVAYKIEWKESATAEVKGKVSAELAAALNAEVADEGNSTLVGKGLVWGVRDNVRWFRQSQEGWGPASTGGDDDGPESIIPRDLPLSVVP